MRALLLLPVISLCLSAQTAAFSPQVSVGNSLTLWSVDVLGASHNVPAAAIWTVAAAHGLGHLDNSTAAQLLVGTASKTVASRMLQVCTDAAAGTAIGAYVKGEANFVTNRLATEIAVGATTVAGVCGLMLPTLQKDASTAAPTPQLMGSEIVIGTDGSGTGLFWSKPSKLTAFSDKLP